MSAFASQISQRVCSSASPAVGGRGCAALEDADRGLELALLGVRLAQRLGRVREMSDAIEGASASASSIESTAWPGSPWRSASRPRPPSASACARGSALVLQRPLVEVAGRVEVVQPQRDVRLDELGGSRAARGRCRSRGTPRRRRASRRSCAAAGATPRADPPRAVRCRRPSSPGTRAGAGSARRRAALPSAAARPRPRRRRASGSEMSSSSVSTVRCLQEDSSVTEGGVYADSSPHARECSPCCARRLWAQLAAG